MPNYDYVCSACGNKFELFQTMKESLKRTCPKCKKRKLTRLIGAGAGIIFKGPDWPGQEITRSKEQRNGLNVQREI